MVKSGTKRNAALRTALCSAASEPDRCETPVSPGTPCAETVIPCFLPVEFLLQAMVAGLRSIVAVATLFPPGDIDIHGTSFSLTGPDRPAGLDGPSAPCL